MEWIAIGVLIGIGLLIAPYVWQIISLIFHLIVLCVVYVFTILSLPFLAIHKILKKAAGVKDKE